MKLFSFNRNGQWITFRSISANFSNFSYKFSFNHLNSFVNLSNCRVLHWVSATGGGIIRRSSPLVGEDTQGGGDKPNRRGPLLSPGDSRGGQALTGGTPIFAAVVTNFFKISIFIFTFLPFFWLNLPVPPSPPPLVEKNFRLTGGDPPLKFFFNRGGSRGDREFL